MINMAIEMHKTGVTNMSEKTYTKILKTATGNMGRDWISIMLPKRFSTSGQNIYKLQLRKPNYIKRAKKINSSWRPLVLRGSMAQRANTGSHSKVDGDGQFVAEIKVPRAHPTPKFVAEEITETTQKDMIQLQQRFVENVKNQMSSMIESDKRIL